MVGLCAAAAGPWGMRCGGGCGWSWVWRRGKDSYRKGTQEAREAAKIAKEGEEFNRDEKDKRDGRELTAKA